MARISHETLLEKINNIAKYQKDLRNYIAERNDNQDKRIALQEEKTEKNTVAIAGIKGVAGVISAFISLMIAGISIYLRKGQ